MAQTSNSRTPMAGGFLLAISLLLGVVVGTAYGQATSGFLAGAAVGAVALVAVWLIDRRRAGRS